jgi:hypothetical protein
VKHPAEFFIKALIIKKPVVTDSEIEKELANASILTMPAGQGGPYFAGLRERISNPPANFDLANKTHRASMEYLRKEGVYKYFHPDDAMNQAWDILTDLEKRLFSEQLLMSRLPIKEAIMRANQENGWRLTTVGVECYGYFFWNVKLLSFDEWGAFLNGRTMLHERYISLLNASDELALYHMRANQALDSKDMVRRAQEIAYFTLEEVAQAPGPVKAKVSSIRSLTNSIIACHKSVSGSDSTIKEVLKLFENFRVTHPVLPPESIDKIAPAGNFSGSGTAVEKPKLVGPSKE